MASRNRPSSNACSGDITHRSGIAAGQVITGIDRAGEDIFRLIKNIDIAGQIVSSAAGHSNSFRAEIDERPACAVFDQSGKASLFEFTGKRFNELAKQAILIVIYNASRSKRMSRACHAKSGVDESDPNVKMLVPDKLTQDRSRKWIDWVGSSGLAWRIMPNKFPLLPYDPDLPPEEQPYHCLIVRGDRFVHQRNIYQADNLFDIFSVVRQVNESEDLNRGIKFRLGVNGWHYSRKRIAPSTASQVQAHAHIIRFEYPIERAPRKKKGSISDIDISMIDDLNHKWGTGIILEGNLYRLKSLAQISSKILRSIIRAGYSFSIFAAPFKDDRLRVFILGRPVVSPLPYFEKGWSFSELARMPIIESPWEFYRLPEPSIAGLIREVQKWQEKPKRRVCMGTLRNDLLQRVQESLILVTLSQNEQDKIYEGLFTESA